MMNTTDVRKENQSGHEGAIKAGQDARQGNKAGSTQGASDTRGDVRNRNQPNQGKSVEGSHSRERV